MGMPSSCEGSERLFQPIGLRIEERGRSPGSRSKNVVDTGAPADLSRRSGESRDDLAVRIRARNGLNEFRGNIATVKIWKDKNVGLSGHRSFSWWLWPGRGRRQRRVRILLVGRARPGGVLPLSADRFDRTCLRACFVPRSR
jgi:hypothetical protein